MNYVYNYVFNKQIHVPSLKSYMAWNSEKCQSPRSGDWELQEDKQSILNIEETSNDGQWWASNSTQRSVLHLYLCKKYNIYIYYIFIYMYIYIHASHIYLFTFANTVAVRLPPAAFPENLSHLASLHISYIVVVFVMYRFIQVSLILVNSLVWLLVKDRGPLKGWPTRPNGRMPLVGMWPFWRKMEKRIVLTAILWVCFSVDVGLPGMGKGMLKIRRGRHLRIKHITHCRKATADLSSNGGILLEMARHHLRTQTCGIETVTNSKPIQMSYA